MGSYDLAPRLQATGGLPLDRRHSRLALGVAGLLSKSGSQKVLAHPVDFNRLVGGGDGQQQPVNRVERAIGVITREGVLMSPAVADLTQFAHVRALALAEHAPEHRLPLVPDHLQKKLSIGGRDLGPQRGGIHAGNGLHPGLAVLCLALTGDKGREAMAQQPQRLAHPLVVRSCHFSPRPSVDGHRMVHRSVSWTATPAASRAISGQATTSELYARASLAHFLRSQIT